MRYAREEGRTEGADEVAALGVEHLGQVVRTAPAMSSYSPSHVGSRFSRKAARASRP